MKISRLNFIPFKKITPNIHGYGMVEKPSIFWLQAGTNTSSLVVFPLTQKSFCIWTQHKHLKDSQHTQPKIHPK
jgi:hypothetical protein